LNSSLTLPSQTVACTTYLVQPGVSDAEAKLRSPLIRVPQFFDIFFPTDFDLLRDLYSLVMSPSPASHSSFSTPIASASSPRIGSDYFSPHSRRGAPSPAIETTKSRGGKAVRGLSVLDHGEFLERWGETEMTRLRDGTNPMIDSYENAKFIC
jgi:hypothetical protein